MRWAVASAFWLLVTLLAAGQVVWLSSQPGESSAALAIGLGWQSTYYLLWIPFTVLIWQLSDRGTPADLGPGRFLALHLPAAFGVAVGQAALTAVIAWSLVGPASDTLWPILTSHVRSRLPLQIIVYAAALGSAQAFMLYSRWRDGEAESARLQAQLAEVRLAALGSQLHPHVLFNGLHAIASLVRQDRNAEAVRLITGMGELLRQLLDSGTGELSLDDEMRLVRRFLELQQVRFSDRLHVSFEIDPAIGETRVPALIVQPLVENAIRHGLAERIEPGHIHVAAREHRGGVLLTVNDDGVGLPAGWTPDSAPGTGLRTLRARLDAIYGGGATLEVSHRQSGGCSATISLPPRKGKA